MSKNRLQSAKSPYLLQHANNPVDWFEWGDEAFEKAATEDKPVFLSIGYSTCHWCHVMERESFEDSEVAALLNENFISIKVDREERPDIDNFYMAVCQMMNSSCGWPLSVVLTPEKKPFLARTYIPKTGGFGRPGMMEILPELKSFWDNRRAEIDDSVEKILSSLAFTSAPLPGETEVVELPELAYQELSNTYDPVNGGFGNRPKFPIPHNLLFLLKYHSRTGKPEALNMVLNSLSQMRKGGLYDHIGFGFHRYSTDARWFLPHFEKMLYDQALLALAYCEAYKKSGLEEFADTVREIFQYVRRDLSHPMGGYFSAEDADSEGVEGKFYVWSYQELAGILDEEQLALFARIYNIGKNGNFLEEATGEETKLNVPYLTTSPGERGEETYTPANDEKNKLGEIRMILFKEREKRIRPGLDDKILTDWNGMIITALARSASVLQDDEMLQSAQKAIAFILKRLRTKDGRLLHRFRDGHAGINGFIDDYAFIIWALIELYRASFDPNYLKTAMELTSIACEDFRDEKGGFYFTSSKDSELLIRKKEFYDGAIPSANSVMASNLLILARYTGDEKLEAMAQKTISQNSGTFERAPGAYSQMMTALEILRETKQEIVVTGENCPETRKVLNKLKAHSSGEIILFKSLDNSALLAEIAPFTKAMPVHSDKLEFYLCTDYSCQKPTDNLETVIDQIR